jgi:hypothetical protein
MEHSGDARNDNMSAEQWRRLGSGRSSMGLCPVEHPVVSTQAASRRAATGVERSGIFLLEMPNWCSCPCVAVPIELSRTDPGRWRGQPARYMESCYL